MNDEKFVTASQDGSIYLWSLKRKKPLDKFRGAHDSWIVSMDSLKQTNILATGGCDKRLKLWGIAG